MRNSSCGHIHIYNRAKASKSQMLTERRRASSLCHSPSYLVPVLVRWHHFWPRPLTWQNFAYKFNEKLNHRRRRRSNQTQRTEECPMHSFIRIGLVGFQVSFEELGHASFTLSHWPQSSWHPTRRVEILYNKHWYNSRKFEFWNGISNQNYSLSLPIRYTQLWNVVSILHSVVMITFCWYEIVRGSVQISKSLPWSVPKRTEQLLFRTELSCM